MKEHWDLVFRSPLPLVVVGVQCDDEDGVFRVSYVPVKTAAVPPQNLLAEECDRQLAAYFRRPRTHRFDVPLAPAKTRYQQRARAVMQDIPAGKMLTYKAVAERLNSSPRAVGGACRANAVSLFVPCHRVIAVNGLGGFMGENGDSLEPQLAVKRGLLEHEGAWRAGG